MSWDDAIIELNMADKTQPLLVHINYQVSIQ